MFKNYKKFLTVFILSLNWTQVEYTSQNDDDAIHSKENIDTTNRVTSSSQQAIAGLSTDQIKNILAKPDLVASLTSKQIEAINPQALAKIVDGQVKSKLQQFIPFSKNNKIQTLPNSFVDSLTPQQAKAILDQDKESRISHLKDYFSNDQIEKLKNLSQALSLTPNHKITDNKAQAHNTLEIKAKEAQARNMVINLAHDAKLLQDTKYQQQFAELMKDLSLAAKETVLEGYTNVINRKKSESSTNKATITDLQKHLCSFIDFIRPSLRTDELAILLLKHKDYMIAIINTYKITSDTIRDMQQLVQALNDNKVSLQDKVKILREYKRYRTRAYFEYFVREKIDLTKALEPQIEMYDHMFEDEQHMSKIEQNMMDDEYYITKEVKNILSRIIPHEKNINIATLNVDYVKYLNMHNLVVTDNRPDHDLSQFKDISKEQIEYLTGKQIRSLTNTQITTLSKEQLEGLTTDQIKAFTDTQIQTLSNQQINVMMIRHKAKKLDDIFTQQQIAAINNGNK